MKIETLIGRVQSGELGSVIVPVHRFIDSSVISALRCAPDVSILAEINKANSGSRRWWEIGIGTTQPTGHDLTTMLVDGNSDALDRALGIIAFNKQRYAINMPPEGTAWITLKGHRLDEPMQDTLAALKLIFNGGLRILGSYQQTLAKSI